MQNRRGAELTREAAVLLSIPYNSVGCESDEQLKSMIRIFKDQRCF